LSFVQLLYEIAFGHICKF